MGHRDVQCMSGEAKAYTDACGTFRAGSLNLITPSLRCIEEKKRDPWALAPGVYFSPSMHRGSFRMSSPNTDAEPNYGFNHHPSIAEHYSVQLIGWCK